MNAIKKKKKKRSPTPMVSTFDLSVFQYLKHLDFNGGNIDKRTFAFYFNKQ